MDQIDNLHSEIQSTFCLNCFQQLDVLNDNRWYICGHNDGPHVWIQSSLALINVFLFIFWQPEDRTSPIHVAIIWILTTILTLVGLYWKHKYLIYLRATAITYYKLFSSHNVIQKTSISIYFRNNLVTIKLCDFLTRRTSRK